MHSRHKESKRNIIASEYTEINFGEGRMKMESNNQ